MKQFLWNRNRGEIELKVLSHTTASRSSLSCRKASGWRLAAMFLSSTCPLEKRKRTESGREHPVRAKDGLCSQPVTWEGFSWGQNLIPFKSRAIRPTSGPGNTAHAPLELPAHKLIKKAKFPTAAAHDTKVKVSRDSGVGCVCVCLCVSH